MLSWPSLSVLVLALLAFGFALRRANELCALRAAGGRLSLIRGRLPPPLFADLADVVARGRVGEAEIRVVIDSGAPRLVMRGESNPALEQACRNLLGRYTVRQIRAGRLKSGPTR